MSTFRARDIRHSVGEYLVIHTGNGFAIIKKGDGFAIEKGLVDYGSDKNRALNIAINNAERLNLIESNTMCRKGLAIFLQRIGTKTQEPAHHNKGIFEELSGRISRDLLSEVKAVIRQWEFYSGDMMNPVTHPDKRFLSRKIAEESTHDEKWSTGRYAALNLCMFRFISSELSKAA